MKKEGAKVKSFLTHAVFILIVLVGLYFIVTSTVHLTGYAVLDASTAKAKLESALASSSAFQQVTQASLCVVINDPEQPLSLQAVKTSAGWTVSEMVGYCSGQVSEDLVAAFPDYDSFSKMVDNPSPRNIAQGAINQDYQILKSKYVELGGNVVCDAAFKVKYCSALNAMASPEQLIDGDMACCIEKMTKAQRQLLEQHLQQGTYRDELGILEQPSGVLGGMNMTSIIFSVVVLIIVIVGIVVGVLLKGGSKPAPAKAAKPVSATSAAPPAPGAMPGAVPGQPTPSMPGTGGATPYGAMAQQAMQATVQAAAQPKESPQITELRDYVKGVLIEGYDPEEIRMHLLEIGWDQQTSDKVLMEAYQQAQQELQQNN